ncbi:MAG: HAMP domain-containing histidine kinase [Catenulispora sp.]|nr:HAMP domain-containing histidine kinase [Catenulispora sp.]
MPGLTAGGPGGSGQVDSTYGGEVGAPPAPRPRPRPGLTVRLRMTIAYGAAVFLTGAVLIYTAYLLFRWRLNHMQADVTRPQGCAAVTKADKLRYDYCQAVVNRQILSQIEKPLIIVLLVSAVVAVLVGYLLAGRFLRPLHRITSTARRVASRPDRALHARIDMEGPHDELVELAQTFDGMLDRLDHAFEGQRRFVGNASHELRTPLAINRTLLEVTLMDPEASEQTRQLCQTLLATNERSERMIEGLLLLAKADNEPTNREDIDLAEVAYRSATQCELEAAERNVAIRTSLQPAFVSGDGILIERIAMNLIQNALRHNVGAGGWVDVLTYDRSQDLPGHGLLVVANTGPEVPPYAVESLFEPFKRGTQHGGAAAKRDPKDKGVGLGLSIVRSVVRAHGGRVAAEPRPGGGLIVRVWLPVRA